MTKNKRDKVWERGLISVTKSNKWDKRMRKGEQTKGILYGMEKKVNICHVFCYTVCLLYCLDFARTTANMKNWNFAYIYIT